MPKPLISIAFLALALCWGAPLAANPEEDEDYEYTEGMTETQAGYQARFFDRIEPGAEIWLDSDYGDPLIMSADLAELSSPYYFFEEVFDGAQLVIHDVDGLTLVGNPRFRAPLLSAHRYAYVILFRDCANITLSSLNCGHLDEGYCSGGVFGFENCSNVVIDNCELWGSGTEGLTFWDSEDISCSHTTIRDCSYSILSAYDSSGLSFDYCLMRGNREFSLLNFSSCDDVKFANCVIWDNFAENDRLIWTEDSELLFTDCAIFNNIVSELANDPQAVRFRHCTLLNNDTYFYEPMD